MMRACGTVLLGFVAVCPAQAEPVVLTNDGIRSLLPKIVAEGEQTRQVFSRSGATTYTDRGRDTYGTWRVDGGRYCSQWPPARNWSCYGVEFDPQTGILVWIDAQGTRTINQTVLKN